MAEYQLFKCDACGFKNVHLSGVAFSWPCPNCGIQNFTSFGKPLDGTGIGFEGLGAEYAAARKEQLKAELTAAIEACRVESHFGCSDEHYNCPADQDSPFYPGNCTCGKDENNLKVDLALSLLSKL